MTVRAVVLGNGISALGALRSLGRSGVPCDLLSSQSTLRHSRFFSGRYPIVPDLSESTVRDNLVRSIDDRLFLLPCSDSMVRVASRLAREYPGKFIAPLCEPSLLEIFLDKGRFAECLKSQRIAAPFSLAPESADSLMNIADELIPNLFLKPRDSQTFFARFKSKGLKVNNRRELEEKSNKLFSLKIPFIVQEFIPGGPTEHIFLDGVRDRNGNFLGLLARRRLRIYPPNFGNSTFMESIPIVDVQLAVTELEKLFEATKFTGIFSAEFKHDQRDSLFKILEVNVRPWWYNEFATQCGVNVALLAYRSLLDLPVERATAVCGKRCIHPYYDYYAHLATKPSGPGSWLKWIFDVWGSSNPWLCWDDPLPGLFEATATCWESVTRRLRGSSK